MNTPGNLTLITDLGESLRAFDAFNTVFAIGAHPFPSHYVGWQGGSVTVDVDWHTSIGIWGVFERRPPDEGKGAARYWNCFGIADPGKDSMLSITVEISPPHQGEDRRTAGVFLRDEAGRLHVGHSGKVGGGRAGIGQRAFRDFSHHLAWQEIATPKSVRELVVFGPLQDGEFAGALSPFIHTVAEFKEHVAMRR